MGRMIKKEIGRSRKKIVTKASIRMKMQQNRKKTHKTKRLGKKIKKSLTGKKKNNTKKQQQTDANTMEPFLVEKEGEQEVQKAKQQK